MKKIPLTRGQFAIVDEADYDWLNQWNWYAEKAPHTFYALRTVRIDGKKKSIRMHRLIMNTPADMETDHIDGEGLNNRRYNLRNATHQDNMINCARWKSGTSKYRGVSWHITEKKWYAQITVNYKNIYIGCFDTEIEARDAYEAYRSEARKNQIIRKENYG